MAAFMTTFDTNQVTQTPPARRVRSTCPTELHAPAHRRAKHAAMLSGSKLVDFLSEASDRCARRVFRKHGLDADGKSLSQLQST